MSKNLLPSIRLILILLVCSFWEVRFTATVYARPVNAQNVDVAKVYSNETSYTSALSDDAENSSPSEVQKAVCTVTAGDVKASAEAVTTKELKGVCQSNELKMAFSSLEFKMIKELEDVKNLLRSLVHENSDNISIPISSRPIIQFQPIPASVKNLYSSFEISKDQSKSTKLTYDQTLTAPMREREILIYNNTLLAEKNVRVFTYYWKIENFTRRIKDGSGITVESPLFSIKGKAFKIKASFQHLHRDFLFLQLEDATMLAKSGNSISLETGGLFKEIQNNTLKYKITVLQQNTQKIKDLVSQDFENHESGFLIPNSALLDSPFVKDDAIIIKIFLYL